MLMLGSLAFLAGCAGQDGEDKAPLIPGTIELISDFDQMRSDGTDAVTFTVNVTDADGEVHDVTGHVMVKLQRLKQK